jgi:hypothetical protein
VGRVGKCGQPVGGLSVNGLSIRFCKAECPDCPTGAGHISLETGFPINHLLNIVGGFHMMVRKVRARAMV